VVTRIAEGKTRKVVIKEKQVAICWASRVDG